MIKKGVIQKKKQAFEIESKLRKRQKKRINMREKINVMKEIFKLIRKNKN